MDGPGTRLEMPDQDEGLVRVRRERDLYRRLLDLGRQEELEPFLREALALIVEVTEARQGYLELDHGEDAGAARFGLEVCSSRRFRVSSRAALFL